MAKIATKKSVRNAKMLIPSYLSIKENDIIQRENFGAFEVIITRQGAIYKNYTGYHIFFSPYCVGEDGIAHETSSYAWLVNLVNTKKAFAGHEEELFEGQEVTKGEILNADIIITEACLSHPMTAFIDLDYATDFARKHMDWLETMTKKYEEASTTPVEEEDAEAQKRNLEHDAKYMAMETIKEEIENSTLNK